MSAWKLAVQTLYDIGGTATTGETECAGIAPRGLGEARRLGMVDHGPWRGASIVCLWWITELGIDWVEGRITLVPAPYDKPSGRPPMRLAATWLSSLPRGIRLQQGGAA